MSSRPPSMAFEQPVPALLKAWEALGCRAAIHAGDQIIMPLYEQRKAGNALDATYDSSGMVDATKADRDSERYLMEDLYKATGIPVYSEENLKDNKYPPIADQNADLYWLIDPLDCTVGFDKMRGGFSVLITLMQKQCPVIGVVYDPVARCCYSAVYGVDDKITKRNLNTNQISYIGAQDQIPKSKLNVILLEDYQDTLVGCFTEPVGREIDTIWGEDNITITPIREKPGGVAVLEGDAHIWMVDSPCSLWDVGPYRCFSHVLNGCGFLPEVGQQIVYPSQSNTLPYHPYICPPYLFTLNRGIFRAHTQARLSAKPTPPPLRTG